MNIAADEAHKKDLIDIELGCVEKLVGILRSAGTSDVTMAMGACKALYNIVYDDESDPNCREMWKPPPVEILGDSFHLLFQTLSELVEIYDDDSDDEDEAFRGFLAVSKTMLALLESQ